MIKNEINLLDEEIYQINDEIFGLDRLKNKM